MPSLITNDLRIADAILFKNSISNNYCYITLGRAQEWAPNNLYPNASEINPPLPIDSVAELKDIWSNMIVGYKIEESYLSLMVKRYNWTSNTIYTAYDDNDPDLFEKNFFVLTDDYNVYKVIDNNYNSPSTSKPSLTTNQVFSTSDGYKWKYMYSLSITQINEFLNNSYIPVSENINTNVTSGELYRYVVTTGPQTYLVTPTISIVGDGVGAEAIAILDNDVLVKVEVTNTGSGYTFADVYINGVKSGTGNTSVVRPVFTPINGHGYSPHYELGAWHVGISASILPENNTHAQIRQISLILNPFSASGNFAQTSNVFRQATSLLFADDTSFSVGDVVTNANGASGYVADVIYVDDLNPSAGVYVYLTNVIGIFSNNDLISAGPITQTVSQASYPQSQKYSGQLIYVRNKTVHTRDDQQLEKYSFVISK